MAQHYYETKGTAKRLLDKLKTEKEITEKIAFLNTRMRYESDAERKDTKAEILRLSTELSTLRKTVV